jgi:hypothetical protein
MASELPNDRPDSSQPGIKHAPSQLNYEPKDPSSKTGRNYDALYTELLVALIVYTGACVLVCISLLMSADAPRSTAWILLAHQTCCLLAEVLVLHVRTRLPTLRKWPTVALNVLLLTCLPFGPVLSAFGLLMVDLAMVRGRS